MKVVAFAVGSDGDVLPFIALGKEMVKRGHEFEIVTFTCFQERIEKNGLRYGKLHGDPEEMMKKMLSEREDGPGVLKAIRELLHKYPELYADFERACRWAELIMYMQFGGLAYHFAEKLKKPCIRTFALPYDPTKLYSPLFPFIKRNSLRCKYSYVISDIMMNWATLDTVNDWRKHLGLSKWNLFRFYKKMYGKRILTLYQYSNVLFPRDPAWKEHIYVTGEWNIKLKENDKISEELKQFVENGKAPLYIGFGSIVSKQMEELQNKLLVALEKTGQRAVFVSAWTKFNTKKQNPNIYYTDYVPFTWLFKRVSAVIHHGGAGTLSLAVRAGKPNLILAFGGDQYFRGKQAQAIGVAPEPVFLPNTLITAELLERKLLELGKEEYSVAAICAAEKMAKEDGCKTACDLIEAYFKKEGK
ncbi:glycosyltransferase [Dorea formicigenerans]|uniref:Uncharacterized protein n=1 Tax=Dorea formicigenerans TaxID=39486 RepID=A0A564TW88_9FIRM|nr:glycosyltransferase [Dorea formicigenerans]VUX11490.1 Uncharacterised protein [Dorea formicigenerans]